MNKLSKLIAPLALLAVWPAAQSQEMARVIASTPIIQQVTVPRQVCTETPVVMQRQRSGAGAVVGALAGGMIGSQIGNGSGQTAATAIGMIGGAILGNQIESESAPVVRTATNCTQQVTYENRVVAYNVVYDYAGRQYTTQMSNDPGSHLNIQVTPTASQMQVYTTPIPPAPVVTHAPIHVRTYPPVIVTPVHRPPVYYNPPLHHNSPVYGLPTVNFRWESGGHHGRGHGHPRRHGHHGDGHPGRWR
jgi:uncharacterized protein YcfJ